MAVKETQELVCDVCGSTRNVKSFTIVADDGAAIVDLCPGDARPLLKLWRAGSTEPRKKRTGTRRPTYGHRIEPVD